MSFQTRVLAPLILALALLAGCSDSGPSACGPVTEEEFDPQSSLHVAGETEVEYLTWPPTSGPHLTGAIPTGQAEDPLSGPLQVAALEAGKVLIQYSNLSAGDAEKLGELAGENVIVAPGADLPDDVVLTAWTTKQKCSAVDMGAHRDFIEVYALAEPAD